jgi:hypothetical protein
MHQGNLGHVIGSNRRPDRRSPGRRWPLVFPVLLFTSHVFRPPTYLGIRPRPTERPGNTTTGHLPARGRVPGRMGIPWTMVWQGVGIYRRGIWDYLLSLLRPRGQRRCGRRCATRHDNRHTLVTELY